MRLFPFASLLALALSTAPSAWADSIICRIDESIAYAPRAACVFPACPSGANCPAPELALDRQASSVELFDPLITWVATCPDTAIAGGCWQATFETHLRLGIAGKAETVGIRLTADNGQ